mgnify:CR=1 FL=1
MKKIYIASAFLAFTLSLGAQTNNSLLQTGNKLYAKGSYNEAVQYYEKYLTAKGITDVKPYLVSKLGASGTGSSNDNILLNLADSYTKLNNTGEAAKWYGAYTEQAGSNISNEVRIAYAQSLRANGKYDEAITQLTAVTNNSSDAKTLAYAKLESEKLAFAKKELAKKDDLKSYKLAIAETKYSGSYAPAILNNKIVFTATEGTINQLVETYHDGPNWKLGEVVNIPSITDKSQGVASFTEDGKLAFTTGWSVNEKGVKETAIYISKNNGSSWSQPELMGATVNAAGSNNKQPHITADGKFLFFSSDRTGGQGGYDIWVVMMNGAEAGQAYHTGTEVNTPYDEEAPFYHSGSDEMVFASNGHVGMGGFDLYRSKRQNGGKFTNVKNLGAPFNSVKDDIYFVARQDIGLLERPVISTDRGSACCLELYAAVKPYTRTFITTITDAGSGAGLPGAKVSITDAKTGKLLKEVTTDAQGKLSVENLKSTSLKLSISKDGYTASDITAENSTANTEELLVDNGKLKLKALEKEKVIVEDGIATFNNILFGFNSDVLEGSSSDELDAMAAYLSKNEGLKVEIGAHTDGKGSVAYNNTLSTKRAKAVVKYLTDAGISSSRLSYKGYGKSQLKYDEVNADGSDNEENRAKNRRVEMKIK